MKNLNEKLGCKSSEVTQSPGTLPDLDGIFCEGAADQTRGDTVEPDANDPFLLELEECYKEKTEYGSPINGKLSAVVKHALHSPLTDDQLKILTDKHLVPDNCKDVRVPKVNKELWTAFKSKRGPDLALQTAQKYMCLAITPLITAMDVMLMKGDPKVIQDCVKDSFRALAHGLQVTNTKRRTLIRPSIPVKYWRVTDEDMPVTVYLFGNDLDQKVEELDKQNRRARKLSSDQSPYSFLGQKYSREYNKGHMSFSPRPGPKGHFQAQQFQKWVRAKGHRTQARGHPYQRK